MKLSAFLLAAATGVAALGATWTGTALAADSYKFAIVPKAMNNPYFDLARDGCEARARELGNVQCIYRGPIEHEPATQVQIIQDFIAQGIDGIAISAADADTVVRVIAQARKANIPVITFDADSPNSARQAAIVSDNGAVGAELGKLLLKQRPEGGTYAILSGGPAAENLRVRVEGVRSALAGTTWVEIPSGSPAYNDDDAALAVQQMHDLKTANPDLGAIIPIGGWPLFVPEAYKSFIDRYRAEFDSGKFSVISGDTLKVQLEALRDGYVNGLIGQRPDEMGARAMDVLLALKEGKKLDAQVIYAGLDIVTQENVGDFLD